MSKKHFVELAATIRQNLQRADVPGNAEAVRAIKMLARDIAEVCGGFNPMFDSGRFLTACGIED